MRRFDTTGLWELLKASLNASPALSVGLSAVLNEFAEELHTYCQDERNMAERIRTLNYTRSELTAYVEGLLNGSKKNIPTLSFIKMAIYFIDSEIDVAKMELEHPERFLTFPDENPPLARWNGKISELLEYSLAPWFAGKLLKPSGEPMDYVEIIKLIEILYGIKVPGAYDRKTEILSRQKPAVFLEKLVAFMKTESKKIFK